MVLLKIQFLTNIIVTLFLCTYLENGYKLFANFRVYWIIKGYIDIDIVTGEIYKSLYCYYRHSYLLPLFQY